MWRLGPAKPSSGAPSCPLTLLTASAQQVDLHVEKAVSKVAQRLTEGVLALELCVSAYRYEASTRPICAEF